jgi:hypothetical protein
MSRRGLTCRLTHPVPPPPSTRSLGPPGLPHVQERWVRAEGLRSPDPELPPLQLRQPGGHRQRRRVGELDGAGGGRGGWEGGRCGAGWPLPAASLPASTRTSDACPLRGRPGARSQPPHGPPPVARRGRRRPSMLGGCPAICPPSGKGKARRHANHAIIPSCSPAASDASTFSSASLSHMFFYPSHPSPISSPSPLPLPPPGLLQLLQQLPRLQRQRNEVRLRRE